MSRTLESPFVVAGVVLLLAMLAVLQYRWIGEVSEAERERLRDGLHWAALRFADDLDREISRVFLAYHPGGVVPDDAETTIIEEDRRWLAAAPYPGLARHLYLTDRRGSELRCLNRDRGSFELCQAPEHILGFLDRLMLEDPPPREDGRVPAVVVHLDRPMLQRFPGELPLPPRLLIIEIDREVVAGELAPELFDRHFAGLDCAVVLSTGKPGQDEQDVIFSSESVAGAPGEAADLEVDLFRLRGYPDLLWTHGLGSSLPVPRREDPSYMVPRQDDSGRGGPPPHREPSRGRPRWQGADHPGPPRHQGPSHAVPPPHQGREEPSPYRGPSNEEPPRHQEAGSLPEPGGSQPAPRHMAKAGGGPETLPGQWRLLVTHRAGSLEKAATALQRRNLAVSAGLLLLLSGSLVLIVSSTRRAQRLARQQMSFMAGVSHELKTPLAAIRSAADNLSHGVVTDPERIREYGDLVDREAKRLSKMVSELLELAGMQQRRRPRPRRQVEPQRIIDGALEECRWLIKENSIEVERRVARDLPAVSADPDALRRAIQNLVENAVKHAGTGGWVAVRARAVPAESAVLLSVSDRGPGIDSNDLPHIFEPFYRGCGPAARATGSGLGLTLVKNTVEAHGGRLSIRTSTTGRTGTTFSIHLPAAAEETPAHHN